jgi:glycosyltransferase involved in cell wall biosynthesis
MSITALKGDNKILVLNDASEDGTTEWLEGLEDRGFLSVHHNPGPDRVGIVGMFDKGIEMAETDIICAFHADMVAYPNLDRELLKHLKKGTVVSATRVEPPLHPPGPEKIIEDFGTMPDEFDYKKWCKYIPPILNSETTEGIFAPWCMYKEDFLAVGGHDELFAPQSREDSDLFNRFHLAGYKFVQTWRGMVYHFTSRGSRFNPMSGGKIGENSPEWTKQNRKSERNFIRKWGHMVQHDEHMKPIIPPKYDIGFKVFRTDINLLRELEPWCSKIYLDTGSDYRYDYIKEEQPNTDFDLDKKIYMYGNADITKYHDIVVTFDAQKLTSQNFQIIVNLSEMIQDSGEIGEMEHDIFKFSIKSLETYEKNLINHNYL